MVGGSSDWFALFVRVLVFVSDFLGVHYLLVASAA